MIPIKTTTGEMMKKLIVPLLFLTFFNPFSASAAMQVLGTKANTAPGHLDADANFTKQNANNAELQATKADKDKVVRLWADHPDGTQIAAKTLIAYDGKIYTALQAFDKVSSSATPDILTAYFKVIGVTNYSELDGKPTLGTAASLNAGTSPNNLLQLDGSGKVPAVDGSQLTGISGTLPDCPSANQTWEWDATTSSAKCVDWQTISADGTTISISGGVLSVAGASASSSGTVFGRSPTGTLGFNPISDYVTSAGSVPIIQDTAPTSESANGVYVSRLLSKGYIKTDDSLASWDITSADWDSTPSVFSFTDETDVTLSTPKVGTAITVAGINTSSPISASGDTGFGYSKNAASCVTADGTVIAGDTVAPCVTSSSSNSTATSATITIGGVADTYTCTTIAGVACTGNYGYTTGTQAVAPVPLQLWVRKVPSCPGGSIASISAKIALYNAVDRRIMPVVFSDDAGEPGTLLYAGSPIYNTGWGSTFTVRDIATGINVATSGSYVWEGFASESSASAWTRDTSITGDVRYITISSMETASVPSTWPTSTDATSTYSMYIYGTY